MDFSASGSGDVANVARVCPRALEVPSTRSSCLRMFPSLAGEPLVSYYKV